MRVCDVCHSQKCDTYGQLLMTSATGAWGQNETHLHLIDLCAACRARVVGAARDAVGFGPEQVRV